MNSDKRVVYCAQDPGGANALVPIVATLSMRGVACLGLIAGPARGIFESARQPIVDATGFLDEDIVARIEAFAPTLFLASHSLGDSIDKRVFATLHDRIPSLYLMDFWNIGWNMLTPDGARTDRLPSAICVVDGHMHDKAVALGFPEQLLHVTGNPHFDHFTDGIDTTHEDPKEVLFISQPIRSTHGALYGFDEFTVFEHLLRALPHELHVRVRLHPKEGPHAYDAYLSERVRVSGSATLEEAISRAGLVVGMFSPVLMQAAAAGKQALSYQPGRIGEDLLPTNVLGITSHAETFADLQALLISFAAGARHNAASAFRHLFASGATARVLRVIDEISR